MSARKSPRSLIAECSLVALLALALAACGSDGSSSGTAQPTLPTATTTTAAPSPTSTIAPSTTLAETTAPTDTAVATTKATTPMTAAATTDVATTDVATTEAADTTPPTDAASGEYALVPSPAVPSQTAPVDANDNHPDGVYYASVSEGGDPPPAASNVVFELVQLFTGQACIDHFVDIEDACVGDYGIETDPTSTVEVDLDGVLISVADAATKQNYRISGAELNELLLGGDPATGAPADYLYSGFGYLVTYQGGVITRLEQWWTP